MEYKKNIIFIIAAVLCIVFSTNIYNSIKSNEYRRLCDKYREQLDRTTEANRELAATIEECQRITGSIGELCNRNISSSQGIIEIAEELRMQIKELEDCCGGFDYNKYYEYYDSYYGIE